MKKIALSLLLAAALLMLTACALDPFEEYENFVMDMDLNARIEDALYSVADGDSSPFFKSSVESIYYDLQSFNEDDYSAGILQEEIAHDYTPGNINTYYVDCVQLILDAIEQNEKGNYNTAKLYYDQALEKYQGAQSLYAQFLQDYGRENTYSY